jgi:hypothetical protein
LNLILVLALLSGVVADDFELPPDIVYSNLNMNGTILGFQIGDYVQVVLQERGGELKELWTFDPLMDYFLAEHVNESVSFEVEDVETYLTKAEDMVRLLRVVSAEAGGTSFSVWMDSVEALGTPGEILGDYTRAPRAHLYEGEVPDDTGGR